MKLTDTQLRHIVRASNPTGERATASDQIDQAITHAAGDTTKEPDPTVVGVRWATEEVLRAADNVLRVTEEVAPASRAAKPSLAFEAIQSRLDEQRKFSLPVPVARPRRADRRPLVPSMATSLVLLVSAVVGVSVLVIVERSRSWQVEVPSSTSVTLSEPGVERPPDASDRPSVQANAQAQASASSASSRPEAAPPGNNTRAADTGTNRHPTAPANLGLSAVAVAPAGATVARSNGSPRAVRGDAVPGNVGSAVGPQAQTQQTRTGPARVAAAVPGTVGVGGAPPQPSSPRQVATALGTAPSTGGAPARATSETLSTCLAARPAALRLSQDEIGKLFKRGEEYMGQGRISAARPLFQRAAEACDMKAAFALGATYDPIMLKKLGATLLDPDVAVARAWYEQARGLGLSEASRELELLSGLPR
jgi:hypothetical protein